LKKIFPEVGGRRSEMIERRVLFPEPFGPTNP
jgi:hypothetical protein